MTARRTAEPVEDSGDTVDISGGSVLTWGLVVVEGGGGVWPQGCCGGKVDLWMSTGVLWWPSLGLGSVDC